MGANSHREAGKWLRGVDLNHRPLGYERWDFDPTWGHAHECEGARILYIGVRIWRVPILIVCGTSSRPRRLLEGRFLLANPDPAIF
jgi:hypothetical protein